MAKIVVTARLPGRWRELLVGHDVVEGELSRAELLAQLADADALLPLLSVRVDAELLAAAPRLSIVANYAVGYDNVDLAACTARKVVATNTPDVLTDATADLAMALLLAAGRRFVEADRLVRGGKWRGWSAEEELVGADFHGTTLGIVGLGRIGRAVAQRARAFGIHVVYWQPRKIPNEEAAWLPLDELLATADAVSLHCPLTAATRHLIGAAQLARMKPTAILVNTARGGIVDEAALAAALHAGRPGFAGLDVFEDEPRVHPDLLGNPRVVVLPHVGSATRGTRAKMAEVAAGCIAERLAGRRPPHVLNPAALT